MTMTAATPTWIARSRMFMPDPEITYHDDGSTIASVIYYDRKGKAHRKDGPAVIRWHDNGVKALEQWRWRGETHRTDGPASIHWHENGVKRSEGWLQNGTYLRPGDHSVQMWNSDGVKIREEGLTTDGTFYTNRFSDEGNKIPPTMSMSSQQTFSRV